MRLRHRLTAALLLLLLLFAAVLLLHTWGSGIRGAAETSLRIAVEQRQGVTFLRRELISRQQRVELLGRVTAGGELPEVRPAAVAQLQADLAAFELRIAALSRPSTPGLGSPARPAGGAEVWQRHYADLVTSYRALSEIWLTFYRDLALRTAAERRSDPAERPQSDSVPERGGPVQPDAAGDFGQAAASGEFGQAVASGEFGQAVASGEFGQAVASGEFGQAVASGEFGQAVASGEFGQAVASGDTAPLVSTMTSRAADRLQRATAALDELAVLAEEQVDVALDRVDRAAVSTDRWMLLALAVSALLAAAVAIALPGLLLGRLQRFRAAVEELTQAAGMGGAGERRPGAAGPGAGEPHWSEVADGELGRAARAVERLAAELATARAAEGEGRTRLAIARREGGALIADLAAQMRPPVDSIVGQCERMIQQAELEGGEETVPELRKILQTGRHHLALLDGIADLARAAAGAVELDRERFEVAPLVDQLATAVGPLADKGGNRLELDIAPGVAAMTGDPTKLRQVLFHLLSHCCSTTEGGSVALRARRIAAPGVDWLRFEVSDNGPGLPPHQQRRLFAGLEAGLDLQGLGREGFVPRLGLAVARRFSQLMGGEIEVASEPGQGTVFIVALPAELPAAASDREAASTEPAAAGPGAASAAPGLLLASGDPHLRAGIRRRQESAGWQVAEVATLPETLRRLSLLRPTALIVDLALGIPEAARAEGTDVAVGEDGEGAATRAAAAEELWQALADAKASTVTAGTAVVLLHRVGRSYLLLGTLEQLVRPIDRERAVAALTRLRRGAARQALVAVTELAARELLVRGLGRDGWQVDEEEADELPAALLARRPAVVVELTRTKESGTAATIGVAEAMQPSTSSFLVRSMIVGGVPVADRLLLLTGPLPAGEDRRLRRTLDRLGEEHGLEGRQLLDSLAELLDRLATPVADDARWSGDTTVGSSAVGGETGSLPGGLQTSTGSRSASSLAAASTGPPPAAAASPGPGPSGPPAGGRAGDELGTIMADLEMLDCPPDRPSDRPSARREGGD